jgi:hypothetical protein
VTRSRPGRSTKDQLRERVTKIRAWLTILTWRYRADIISCSLSLIDLTPNLSCAINDMVVRTTRQEKTLPIEEIDAKG